MFVDLFHTKKLRLALIYIAFMVLVQFLQDTVLARLAGILSDMTYGENTVLFTVVFPLVGFGSGLAAGFALNRTFLAYMFTAFICLLLTGCAQMLRVLVLQPAALFYCLIIVAVQALVSMPIAALLYFPAEQISTRFEA